MFNTLRIKYFNFLKYLVEKHNSIPFKEGDYIIPVMFDDLTEKQTKFLKSREHFIAGDITQKGEQLYVDVGYNIPFKAIRFEKLDITSKNRVLFLQFNIKIDTHGEPDPTNIFRNCYTMSELFPKVINESLPNTIVDFYDYSNIYRLKDGYYINNTNLKDYDFVFFGFMSKQSTISMLIVNYLKKYNVPFLRYENFHMFDTKSYGMDLTESLGYPYIPTISTYKLNNKILGMINDDFGYPIIVKKIDADRGTGVWKINSSEELIEFFKNNNELLMIQKLIPNDGDFRVIVIKNKVELVIKRKLIKEGEFRSNVALGNKAIKADVPDEIKNMCVDISKHIECDILGFDIIQDLNDGKYYVMEINISPHMATFCVVSGINLPQIITDYIVDKIKLKKGV